MSGVAAYIAAGSNLSDRAAHIAAATRMIERTKGVRLLRSSAVIETAPALGSSPGQGPYLNVVIEVESTLSPRELMRRCLEIEQACGRERKASERWGPRTLDLDLLLFGQEVLDEPGLVVPHPRMHERTFVLGPLSELAPDLRHPILGLSVQSLLRELQEQNDGR